MSQQPQALPDGSIRLPSGEVLPPIYRQDGSAIKPISFGQGAGRSRVVTLRRFEPVVFLDGEVVAEAIDNPAQSGHRWVRVVEGTATLTQRAKVAKVALYRDMCLGRVPNVEASPYHWQLWNALQIERGKGKIPKRGTIDLGRQYHPECARRREANEGGVERMGQAEIDELIKQVEAGMSTDDHAAAFDRAKDLGLATDEEIDLGVLLSKPEAAHANV